MDKLIILIIMIMIMMIRISIKTMIIKMIQITLMILLTIIIIISMIMIILMIIIIIIINDNNLGGEYNKHILTKNGEQSMTTKGVIFPTVSQIEGSHPKPTIILSKQTHKMEQDVLKKIDRVRGKDVYIILTAQTGAQSLTLLEQIYELLDHFEVDVGNADEKDSFSQYCDTTYGPPNKESAVKPNNEESPKASTKTVCKEAVMTPESIDDNQILKEHLLLALKKNCHEVETGGT